MTATTITPKCSVVQARPKERMRFRFSKKTSRLPHPVHRLGFNVVKKPDKKEGREALFQSCDAPFVLAGNAMRQTHATRGSLPAYVLRASSASEIPDDFRAVPLERDGEKPDGFAIPFHVSVSAGAFCRRRSCCR
ncbi:MULTISPECIES: hypothetical protein [Agrobacterium]|uniref:hypothetical protein n=1 Tax=Agrobacterium TaxID=357 RepID=UPI0022B82608|nr:MULTISPECIES: hypothetical protein [Agrobacterium]MCZ7888412.1 hypothetical protein [Agrobacterium salinitolerans]MDA5628887.1 hypothetical protein [Agrobacterium sp. ST15.16.055]MDA6981360.1 hypothetical protein [Agrobacterium salinitolerans]